MVVLERDAARRRRVARRRRDARADREASLEEEPLLALGLRQRARLPGFVAELRRRLGPAIRATCGCGTLLVARDRDEAEALERELAMRTSSACRCTRLRPSEARRLEPGLAPALRLALDVPDDHAIDPRALTVALAEALRRAGGELRTRLRGRRGSESPRDRVERRAARRRRAGSSPSRW